MQRVVAYICIMQLNRIGLCKIIQSPSMATSNKLSKFTVKATKSESYVRMVLMTVTLN